MGFAAIVEANLGAPGNTKGTAGFSNPLTDDVASVGEASGEGFFARGAVEVSVSAGIVFSICSPGECVLDGGASVGVGISSGSVDVEVFVRYNAASNHCAGA